MCVNGKCEGLGMYLPPHAFAKNAFLEHPLHPPMDLDGRG